MAYNPANGTTVWRTTFASAVASGVDTTFWNLIQTGSGQTIAQSGGNLVMTSGTTANSESIIRSKQSWQSFYLTLRYQALLSQRIANNNFVVELVDVLGDGLAYTINSATSVTVTFPTTNPFTSANVGQGVYLGAITGAAGVPMRGTIASVSGLTVTFTVAGWPATGTGTLSLFGWNFHQFIYNGTTATNMTYDAARRGYNSGASTLTINTSASPGHVVQLIQDENTTVVSDALATSSAALQYTQRGSRLMNMPTNEYPLFVQIRSLNGTTAPASTTTFTVGFVAVDDSAPAPVIVEGANQMGGGMALPVNVINNASVTAAVTGYPTAAAAADGYANPTITHIGADGMLFNGSTWDRERGVIPASSVLTGPVTATTNGTTSINYNHKGVLYHVIFGSPTGTSPTINLQLQGSLDNTNWFNWGPVTGNLTAAGSILIACHPTAFADATSTTLAAFTTGATVTKLFSAPIPKYVRVVATAGGTTPSWPVTAALANLLL